MPEFSQFPACYHPSSVRVIVTPSAFARENLFYIQEAGHIRLVQSHAGTQRSSLDSFLIVQVAAGSGTLQYGPRRWELRAGQCFWVDCRRPHGYRSADNDPWELRWVHFNGRSAPAFYERFGTAEPVFTPPDAGAVARRLDTVLQLARRWDAPGRARSFGRGGRAAGRRAGGPARAGRPRPGPPPGWRRCAPGSSTTAPSPSRSTASPPAFISANTILPRSFKQRYGETIVACLHAARIDRRQTDAALYRPDAGADRRRLRVQRTGVFYPPLQGGRRPDRHRLPPRLAQPPPIKGEKGELFTKKSRFALWKNCPNAAVCAIINLT